MTTLYYAPGACSLAPHIALREAGIEPTLSRVDLAAKRTESGANYLDINPKGYVPALETEHDGNPIVLTEVAVILQYIADAHAAAALAPARDRLERYRLQEWLSFVSAEVHKSFTPLFRPNTPEAFVSVAKDVIAGKLQVIDDRLARDDGGYLMGEAFSVADAYCFTVVNWSNFKDIDLARWPNLAAYMRRIAARPAVQAALGAEGLI